MPTTETYSILTTTPIRKEDHDAVRSLFDRLVSDAEIHIKEKVFIDHVEFVCWAEDAILWGGDDPDNPGPITEFLVKLQKYMGDGSNYVLYRELSVKTFPEEVEDPQMPLVDHFAWILTKHVLFPWVSIDSLAAEIAKRVEEAVAHE